jgi:hypothetical protein
LNRTAQHGIPLWKLILRLLPVLALVLVSVSVSGQVRSIECAGFKATRKALEAEVEKFRRGESSDLRGGFSCPEAFPILTKYALDPDPKLRERITFYLKDSLSPKALELFVRQIETYPLDKNRFPAFHAAEYPCHAFETIRVRSLAEVLTARIKSRDTDFNREEIYLLGCLGRKDQQARKSLEAMSQPSFPLHFSENDRRFFVKLVTYALAEAGSKEAEEQVLAEIETGSKSGDPHAIKALLEEFQGFTNCRILLRFAQFITDKRDGLETDLNPEARLSGGRIELETIRLLIGDMAISSLTYVLGPKVTGETDYKLRRHTDAEMERIYQRVTRAVESGKFSTCRDSKIAGLPYKAGRIKGSTGVFGTWKTMR